MLEVMDERQEQRRPRSKSTSHQASHHLGLLDIKENVNNIAIPYDILVYAVGTEPWAFGIRGVKESAAFPDGSEEEADRLMHIIVVGGGPTGVEFSDELHGFIKGDSCSWYHELADNLKIILLEALPNVLPMFSRELTQYRESTFKEQTIEVLTKTMVKEVKYKTVVVKNYKGVPKSRSNPPRNSGVFSENSIEDESRRHFASFWSLSFYVETGLGERL
ncbi:NADH:ubiquinone oxidoreductase [Tulasnella sp. 425]|nr:NADH:ubiquinone oxidoreductase [Tulasnella sp. 425]